MKVFINPGHSPKGNPDPGAVNPDTGLKESDVAYKIGVLAVGYLRKAGCDVKYLQSDNLCGEGEGENVCETANDWQADIFVSIHCNAANGKARGAETFCYEEDSDGYKLAGFIQSQVYETQHEIDSGFIDRGVKIRPSLALLRNTEMPAVLCEVGFIDNQADAWLMFHYFDEIARAVARGVTDYEKEKLNETAENAC